MLDGWKDKVVRLVVRWHGRGLGEWDYGIRHGAIAYFDPRERRGFLRVVLLDPVTRRLAGKRFDWQSNGPRGWV